MWLCSSSVYFVCLSLESDRYHCFVAKISVIYSSQVCNNIVRLFLFIMWMDEYLIQLFEFDWISTILQNFVPTRYIYVFLEKI